MNSPPDAKGIRLLYLVTHAMTARLLVRGQLEWMRRRGFEVSLVSSPPAPSPRPEFDYQAVAMAREISPFADLAALIRLVRLMRRTRPTIVNASTPKAGLLGMLAARLAQVPVRIYTLRGLRLETTRGLRRRLLTVAERLACGAAHRVVCVSPSLRRRCLELGLCPPERATVLADGSSNGVDVERFAAVPAAASDRLRGELGLTADEPVIGFVGRLTHDKGVEELPQLLELVRAEIPAARLLVVGGYEPGDPVDADTRTWLDGGGAVTRTGEVEDTAPYYSLMRALVFPSAREGLPNVPLEAAAAGVPTVGYATTGTVDAVRNGETGLLTPAGDLGALSKTLVRYLGDPALARRHGNAARERVSTAFRPERVWRALEDEYLRLLGA